MSGPSAISRMARPAASQMRIYALPLTRRPPPSKTLPLVYYYARMPESSGSSAPPSYFNRALNFANSTWNKWGKEKSGWKIKVHTWGNKAYEKVDFEELALGSIDPALGPKLTAKAGGKEVVQAIEKGEHISIQLLHPTRVGPSDPLAHLTQLLKIRTPKHRRWFWIFLGISPLTAPFALVPIIPNIPFFFCAWRAWSHWKAYKAASYLQQLVKSKSIQAVPSPIMDEIYASYTTRSSITKEGDPILISRGMIPGLLLKLRINPEVSHDLERAVEQAQLRLAQPSVEGENSRKKEI
ncbi:hypothetical protein FRB95_007382 [Tulasnella sp. JGI-2019a]|nr:hypothetical protein FRB95_007382 [Tulasnella sp. JGI-2019a]